MASSIYDSTSRDKPKVKKRVADRSPEEVAAYKKHMEEVRDEVEIIRQMVADGKTVIEPTDLQKPIELLGADLVDEIIHDEKERPHRRICQGRAASCHPESERRWAYVTIAGAQRSIVERAIAVARGLPDPGEPPKREWRKRVDPELEAFRSEDGNFSFGDSEQPVETELQRQLREVQEALNG